MSVVSSAGIERLFSETGMPLIKRPKRMLPKVIKKVGPHPVQEEDLSAKRC